MIPPPIATLSGLRVLDDDWDYRGIRNQDPVAGKAEKPKGVLIHR